jgi:hypothetical protein
MDMRLFFLFASLLGAQAAAADAYRWVDEDGVVHYSDRPREGAERVELSDGNTVGMRSPSRRSQASTSRDESDEDGDTEPVRYESLEVASPAAEETLWNIEGVLNVRLALTPALRPGHQVRIYFDGAPRMVSGTSFQIEEVWRGAHNIQAEILNEAGELMIRSQPHRFYVQQNTVNF